MRHFQACAAVWSLCRLRDKKAAEEMRERCAAEVRQKAEYYRAVGQRDDREDMLAHAVTCEDLLRIISALKVPS